MIIFCGKHFSQTSISTQREYPVGLNYSQISQRMVETRLTFCCTLGKFLSFHPFIYAHFLGNMALRRTTSQSSTYDGYGASRAVDGNTNTIMSHGSCSCTDHENKPWWRVTLSNDNNVRKVKITNRQTSSQRLTNFDVLVGRSSSSPTSNYL